MKVAFESTAGSGGVAPTGQSKASGTIKKALVGILVMGALSTMMASAGTFASFTAEVDNAASIQTGTLVLDSKGTAPATDCFSTDPAAVLKTVTIANLASCGSIFGPTSNMTSAGGTITQNLTVMNEGSITPSIASFKVTCANNSNPTNGFAGSADLCTITSLLVAETNAAGTLALASGAQVYGSCATTAVASCTTSAGPASGPVGTTVALTAAGFTTNTNHYYLIKVTMGAAPDNSYQGRNAGLSLNWKLTE